jgi:hypothetical protein
VKRKRRSKKSSGHLVELFDNDETKCNCENSKLIMTDWRSDLKAKYKFIFEYICESCGNKVVFYTNMKRNDKK